MIHIPDSIFPLNEKGEKICPKCQKVLALCDCPAFDPSLKEIEQSAPQIKTDKTNRHGKIVTIISHLPENRELLRNLCTKLKTRVGSGGTFYIDPELKGVVEIQGQKLSLIKEILSGEGFKI